MNGEETTNTQGSNHANDPLSSIGHASSQAETVLQEEKVVAALCYVPFGAFLRAGLSSENKNSKFVDFHFRRATFLLVGFLIMALILGALSTLLASPFYIVGVGVIGYCGYQAYSGNYFEFTFVRVAMNSLANFLK